MTRPELPEGWHYAEDLAWDDDVYLAHRRRRIVIGVVVAVLVAVALVGWAVLNAASHYARGVEALGDGSYESAVAELSAATILVVPYRDAQALVAQAQAQIAAERSAQAEALTRSRIAGDALYDASLALDAEDAQGVVSALQPLSGDDVRAALGEGEVGAAADALALRLTGAAQEALKRGQWGRAATYATALLVLEPSDPSAEVLAAKAKTGAELSARLASARDAARRGKWRQALRLALAVTAVRRDFPGAASVIAAARKALAPRPSPRPAVAPTAVAPSAPAAPEPPSTSTSQPPPP
jgi:hypothetical protein